ncbi:hypothetical protein [Halorussus ruber]|uniref:hypothetical protein n=1 Tax=Halorussus ruber TaxID=1126238 RepID=UPI001092FF2B|nr:hypothetical protein [Halorussus ruber]
MSNATTERTASQTPDSSTADATGADPPSASYRLLTLLLFVGTAVAGFAGATSTAGGFGARILGSFAAGLVLLASVFVAPVLVYADAVRVRALDLDWSPRPVVHAAGAFVLTVAASVALELVRMPLLSAMHPVNEMYYSLSSGPPRVQSMLLTISAPLGTLYYLARRNQHLDGKTPSRYWWLLLPAVVAVGAGYLAAELAAPGSLTTVAGGAMVVASLFPVGAYMDARYLRSRSSGGKADSEASGWRPNPAVQFLLSYLSVLVFPISVLYPAYAVGYLARRFGAGR